MWHSSPGTPPHLLKPLAGWPVWDSQHHTTVFGSVLTGGMSCTSFARLEAAQSLTLSESASDTSLKSLTARCYHPLPSEISGHRKGRSRWTLKEVTLSAPLWPRRLLYLGTPTLSKKCFSLTVTGQYSLRNTFNNSDSLISIYYSVAGEVYISRQQAICGQR